VTARDRTVLIVVGLLAVSAGFWFLVMSPKSKSASDLSAQVAEAQQRLTAAQAGATSAEAARRRYADDYATVARLGKAVPVEDDVPSLVYQLSSTANANHVDFRSIKLTATGGPTPSAAPASAQAAAVASATGNTSSTTPSATIAPSALPPGASVGPAGFPTMPFSFDFTGSFFDMQKFLRSLDALTTVDGKSIKVKGRLLTVDGVSLTAGPKGFPQVDASVIVTAYLLPADEGLTAGGTPTTPASTSGTATASTTSGTSGTAPAASLIGSN
jgi:type II secretory pathway pseudopilin PulG